MKKSVFVSLLAMCLFGLKASAQTNKTKDTIPVFSIADSASYTGNYKYEGLPFQYMEVSVKDGRLTFAGGEYNGFLNPVKDKKDVFDADGAALFTFSRNSNGKVTDLRIDYQGQSYIGKRE